MSSLLQYNFDATTFTWIGSVTDEPSVCVFWAASGIASWRDMQTKPWKVGGSGVTSDLDIYANVLRNMFHLPGRLWYLPVLVQLASARTYLQYLAHDAARYTKVELFGALMALSIAVGFVVAFLSALVVVKPFVRFISRHGFGVFAWYRIAIGALALVLLLRH